MYHDVCASGFFLHKQALCLYCVLALLIMLQSHSRRCKLSVWAGPLVFNALNELAESRRELKCCSPTESQTGLCNTGQRIIVQHFG